MRDLYEKARKVDVGITLDMVSAWMRAQPNKQTRNYKNYNSYTAPFPKYEFQIDLMDVTSLLRDVGSEIRNQLRYGLACIDIFSKKCHIVPTENKDGDDVYKAVMECFKVLGQPSSIYSDDEGALNSKKLQTFFKEEGITHVITKTHANQAERMIRMVKKMIEDRLRHYKTKTWTCHKSHFMREFSRKMPLPKSKQNSPHRLCASLGSRNGHGHVARAVLCENLQQK